MALEKSKSGTPAAKEIKQKHENREDPLQDHVPGHLGYTEKEHLKEPPVKGIKDPHKQKRPE